MHKHICKFALAGALLCGPLPLLAQDEEPDEVPVYDEGSRECIDLRQIRRTRIVDDRNILFYMRGDTVYHNILPRQCGGLSREDRFSYETSIGRLCRLDMIRVLYDDPFGLREGNRCGLGLFHKMSREDADAFREESKKGPMANPLPMPDPEEVGESGDQDGGEDEAVPPQPQ